MKKNRGLFVTLGSILLFTSYAAFAEDNARIIALLESINNEIPAGNAAITQKMNDLFINPIDALFPTPSSNANVLNTVNSSTNLAGQLTQGTVQTQLSSIPAALNTAYQQLSLNPRLAAETAPQETSPDVITNLTLAKPSYDSLYLPWNTCTPNSYNNLCLKKAPDSTLARNAQNFSFDSFFAPTSNTPITNGDSTESTAQNYIAYALKTYAPLINTGDTAGSGGASIQKPFFVALNDKLQQMDKAKANAYLASIVTSDTFQKYWIELRSVEARNSLLLSNFNYLAAERTPQKGLGKAYQLGLPDDASPVQVEQALVNSTVYNPDWYSQMKTAAPATLQRQQLLLTSLLVRLMYHNQQINERNLATQLIIASSSAEQSKMGLQLQEQQLQTLIGNSSNSQTSSQQQWQQQTTGNGQ
ncbi:MAG: hypothetical protein A3F10_04615 [Coxiella sp. RIFCSPHIGHO2_12_FULL_42_15]|nr:MAG: hypothetical protein A3F10_04615 [Coxiella sp. RIFCSPHIGHO2_12_FULL_42_15]